MRHLAPWMDRNEENEKKNEAYIYYAEISPSDYAVLHPTHILSCFPDSIESLCCWVLLYSFLCYVHHCSITTQQCFK